MQVSDCSARLAHVALLVEADVASGRKPGPAYTPAMHFWYVVKSEDDPKLDMTGRVVLSIRRSDTQREILEALILSSCPAETIERALAVPREATAWYRELFFDTAAFLTNLDRIEYLTNYEDDFGRELKSRAASLGYEFVLFTYANLVPKTEVQKQLVERMFMATAYKAMAMNYNGIRTEITRNAVKHAELMLKAYEALRRYSDDDPSSGHDLTAFLTKAEAEKNIPTPSLGEIF